MKDLKGKYKDAHWVVQLAVLFFVWGISAMVFSFVGMLVAIIMEGVDISNAAQLEAVQESLMNNMNALKMIQLFSAIGTFLVPSLLFAWLISDTPERWLMLDSKTALPVFLLVIVVVYTAAAPISWLVELNNAMELPKYLGSLEEWMRNKEDELAEMTTKFLEMDSVLDLLLGIIIIGAVPALGEELLFRGVVQRFIGNAMKNMHWGIFISAFIFSAIHLQFYGFLPRLALGMLFGYLLLWSRNLWVPILAHFVHNSTQVFVVYLYQSGYIETNIEEVESVPLVPALVATLIFIGVTFYFFRITKPIWEADKDRFAYPSTKS